MVVYWWHFGQNCQNWLSFTVRNVTLAKTRKSANFSVFSWNVRNVSKSGPKSGPKVAFSVKLVSKTLTKPYGRCISWQNPEKHEKTRKNTDFSTFLPNPYLIPMEMSLFGHFDTNGPLMTRRTGRVDISVKNPYLNLMEMSKIDSFSCFLVKKVTFSGIRSVGDILA